MRHKLVIFDWDGTLMDSASKIINCMQTAARHCEVDVPDADAVANIIGISLLPAIKQLFSISDDALAEKIKEAYKNAFVEQDNTPSPLFQGVMPMLNQLYADNRAMAVATGKARRGLNRAWQQTNTKHFFSASRCADDAESKPSPDMLIQLLDELQVSPSEAVMVGDTVYDMQMAEQIGMDRIGVSYGVHAPEHLELHAPLNICASVSELHKTLMSRV